MLGVGFALARVCFKIPGTQDPSWLWLDTSKTVDITIKILRHSEYCRNFVRPNFKHGL